MDETFLISISDIEKEDDDESRQHSNCLKKVLQSEMESRSEDGKEREK